jgi:type I restriction enzyme S subunit
MSNLMLPLKSLAKVSVSNVDKKSVEGEQPVRLCNYTEVYYNAEIHKDMKFMSATATREQIREFTLQPGDVLVTKDSETSDDIAVPAYVRSCAHQLLCGYHLAIIRIHSPKVLSRYIYWAMAATSTRQKLAISATGVTRFGLRRSDLTSVRIRVPAIQEQRAITELLDTETTHIDALIDKKMALIQLLSSRRASITHAAVSGKSSEYRHFASSALPWLEERPQHWDEVLLRLVARLGSGHTPSRDHPEWWVDCTIPWITTGEVKHLRSDRVEYLDESQTREKISELGLANSAAELHPPGTVVLCRTAASAGYSAIMKTSMTTSQDFATWTCGMFLRPRFLLLCLRAMRQDLLGRLAMGSTHKTIYMPEIRSIRIPLPPVAEQEEIVDRAWRQLNRIDHMMDVLGRQITLLRERRQALITAAVTGELDVTGNEG